MWVRGLKHYTLAHYGHFARSHPMWVRGLKRQSFEMLKNKGMSHPMWVRGLKHTQAVCCLLQTGVAPHVGAWIETTKPR